MEQVTTSPEATKKCSHCQKEIPYNAKRCPHCQADLRNWFVRHWILTGLFIFICFIFWGNVLNQTLPGPTATDGTPLQTADSLMAQNSPTIKELGTLPKDYLGKSFTLAVKAQDDRYYNYGFSDEGKYYSLELWDNSVSGEFEGVYGYLLKTPANQELINRALNDPVLIKVHVSLPASKWEDNSNAFLQIDSWEYLEAK